MKRYKPIDMEVFHSEKLKELPIEIKDKSVEYLRSVIEKSTILEIKEVNGKDSGYWWASEHFGWGMWVRNRLRDNVCLDDQLPSGSWDDYYVPLVEIAIGLRQE